MNADLLVLSETARPCTILPDIHWFGEGVPGLAVVSLTGLSLTPFETTRLAMPLMGGFAVEGFAQFHLVAIWPVQQKGGASYHDILISALDEFRVPLSTSRSILVGDFNSNTRVSFQKRSHPKVVKAAEQLGLVSAYHAQTGEVHGAETVATYNHHNNPEFGFHIDYAFISKSLCPNAKIQVLNDPVWSARSDHFPIVLDIPNDVLQSPLPTIGNS